jgi:hypothetical protein
LLLSEYKYTDFISGADAELHGSFFLALLGKFVLYRFFIFQLSLDIEAVFC